MTTMALAATAGQSRLAWLIGVGVLLGVAFTLSPLSVISLAILGAALVAGSKGLSAAERRWYWSLMSIGIVLRLIAIALLFYTADPRHPFASFFGDEDLYKFRTIWLRNIGQQIPMSPADVIYSFDDVGHTSYIYVLAYVQALVGDAPYALHVFSMALYCCGVLALYRMARASFGGVVAMGGLVALLCLPSLALWSIAVLKEPMNVFVIALELVCAVAVVRAPKWWQKALAVVIVIVAAGAMESLRTGGALTAAIGMLAGGALVFVLSKGRRVAFALMLAPLLIVSVASVPAVQDRALASLRRAAHYHGGHVLTPGYSYRLLNPRYYADRGFVLNALPKDDVARYSAKAVWAYFIEPLPWEMKSASLLAYMPEQFLWYTAALLLPFGILAGARRDVVLTAMLTTHALAAILIIALSSGNIGTLIRHRSLALPYIVWLSAVGAHDLAQRVSARRESAGQRSNA